MSFPTYINFQVNNSGGGRSNMVVHSNAVILMLLSLFPESFGIFFINEPFVINQLCSLLHISSGWDKSLDFVSTQFPDKNFAQNSGTCPKKTNKYNTFIYSSIYLSINPNFDFWLYNLVRTLLLSKLISSFLLTKCHSPVCVVSFQQAFIDFLRTLSAF